jgi:cystathionine beta-lyase/cystathionine gamma-synthase
MNKKTRVQHPPRVDVPADNRPLLEPIHQNVKWDTPSIAEAQRIARGERPGFFYSRMANPGTRQLELLLAELQGREDCLTCASGVNAVAQSLFAMTRVGDHVVSFIEGYGPTRQLLRGLLARFGVTHTLLSVEDLSGLAAVLASRPTRLVFFESPTTPAGKIADVAAITALAHAHGALAVMDNTQAGLHQHGEHPVDVFVHSLTKFATGAGDVMGGAVIADRAVLDLLRQDMLLFGAPVDPFAASLMVRGLKTYFVRYREQSAAATEVARFLETHPACTRVMHPGLDSHPQAALARAQMREPGCVITFSMRDGAEAGRRFAEALRLFARTPSYGSTESLVMAPQFLQPRDLTPEERAVCGIDDGTVRLSIGLEEPGELCADLAQALAAAEVTSRL